MTHKFTETMTDVGGGIGSFTEKGLYPLATLPVVFGVADMTTGVMKGVTKRVSGESKKKTKTKKKTKSKSRKRKKKK